MFAFLELSITRRKLKQGFQSQQASLPGSKFSKFTSVDAQHVAWETHLEFFPQCQHRIAKQNDPVTVFTNMIGMKRKNQTRNKNI